MAAITDDENIGEVEEGGNDEEPQTNQSEASDSGTVSHLGSLQLAAIVFYSVSGGPYGIEDSVRAAGVFWALIGFTVMPLVWSLPEALMTAELSCAYPEASGSVVWVEKAFGPFAGWIDGCLTWMAGATDNSIYPGLFLDYLLQVLNQNGNIDGSLRYAIVVIMAVLLAFINYRGLSAVGNISISICLLAMSPFVVLCLWSIPQIDPSRWLQWPTISPAESSFNLDGGFFPDAVLGGVLLRPFLNNLYWNLNSFDSAGNFAGDVKNPARTFPKAMVGSVFFVSFGYLLPLLVATGVSDASQEDWENGYLATVASSAGGSWLGAWMVFGAAISNIGQFEAELSSDSFMLMGMGDRRYLPEFFSRRSPHGTPTAGVLFCTLVILVCLSNNMAALVEMENFCYSVSLLMEYAAFVKLRITEPELERPFRVPAGVLVCSLLLVPNCFFLVLVMALASYTTIFVCLGTVAGASLMYWCRKSCIHRTNSYDLLTPSDDY